MAGFFDKITGLFGNLTNIFKTQDLDNSITEFQTKIDTIISDLILPYASPNDLSSKDRFRELIELLDSKKCNKIAITLSSNLDKNYTKLQLEQFASSILIGKDTTECKDDTCSNNEAKTMNNDKTKVSKKEICNAVAIHYVKILNLIAAILSAVNPTDNICLNRLRNLITIMNKDEQTGVSSICDSNSNVVKNSIMNEPGFRELIMLYYYHLMQDTETEEEKTNVRSQFENLTKTFANLVMPVSAKTKNNNAINTAINNAKAIAGINNNENNNNNNNENNELSNKSNSNQIKNVLNGNNNGSNSRKEKNVVTPNNLSRVQQEISNKINSGREIDKQQMNEQFADMFKNINNLSNLIKGLNSKSTTNSSISQDDSTIRVNTSNIKKNSSSNSTISNSQQSQILPTNTSIANTASTGNTNTKSNSQQSLKLPTNTTTSNTNTTSNSTSTTPSNSTSTSTTPSNSTSTTPSNSTSTTPSNSTSTTPSNSTSNTPSNSTTPILEQPQPQPQPQPQTNTGNSTSQSSSQSSLNSTINSLKIGGGGNNNKTNGNNKSKTSNGSNGNVSNRKNNTKKNNKSNNMMPMSNNKSNNMMPMPTNNTSNMSMVMPTNNTSNMPMPMPTNNTSNTSNTSNKNMPKIKQFINFVNAYSKIDKIDDDLLKFINSVTNESNKIADVGFKTYSHFSPDSQADMYIRKDGGDYNLNQFCKQNANESRMIPINIKDPKLSNFVKIYKDMKTDYITNCENLFNILEKNILMKAPVNETNTNPHFTVNNIGYSELVTIETDVRNILVEMYAKCHEQYQKGMVELYNALKPELTNV